LGAVFNPILKTSSLAKQTLLVGLFHPVQLGVHLLEHAAVGGFSNTTSSRVFRALNPFSNERFVDLDNNPIHQQLVIHGLQLRMFDAESLMDEGVMSHGFVRGLPYAGAMWNAIHDATFQKMIPNMKMAMAQDILERNMTRYHDAWTKQEAQKLIGSTAPGSAADARQWGQASIQAQSRIYRLTAEQVNAGFGGIDWSKMPVNKTGQDVLRLLVLAPDFLLARAQFVGDAFRPGGAESRQALGVGFALQYLAARAINYQLNDGDAKWNVHDWNRIVYNHKAYSLRTVQGDALDSILDTRTFLSHRINPVLQGAVVEPFITQKDTFGHPVTPGQMMLDFAKNVVPMPLQGGVDTLASKIDPRLRPSKNSETILDTLTTSMTGLRRQSYRTPAERVIFKHFDNLGHSNVPDDDLSLEQKYSFNALRDKFREGKLKPGDITAALNNPKANLKQSEVKYLFKTAKDTQLVTRARQLPINQVIDAWNTVGISDAEKTELAPIIQRKLKTLAPSARMPIQEELNNFRRSLTPAQNLKINQAIMQELKWEQPPIAHPQP
jgi:hypothetical protein